MVPRTRCRVVSRAGGMGVRARPEYSAYSVAKTGLMRMTEALAGALEGLDVRVFDVAPGVVDTPMTRAMPMWRGSPAWARPRRGGERGPRIPARGRAQGSRGVLRAWGRRLRLLAASPAA